jgi:hypothetical protein
MGEARKSSNYTFGKENWQYLRILVLCWAFFDVSKQPIAYVTTELFQACVITGSINMGEVLNSSNYTLGKENSQYLRILVL